MVKNGFIILLYHSISNEKQYPYTVSPEEFRQQMDILSGEKFNVISLKQAVDAKFHPKKINIVITFDDGYKDNYINAFPVLEHYRYPATFFVVTKYIAGDNEWEGSEYPQMALMTWDHLLDLSKKGHIIGAHTHAHSNLKIAGDELTLYELDTSIKLIKEKIKKDFIPFAYPYGLYRKCTIEILRQIGCTTAVVVDPWINYQKTNHFVLRRFDINKYVSRSDFLSYVNGINNPKDIVSIKLIKMKNKCFIFYDNIIRHISKYK